MHQPAPAELNHAAAAWWRAPATLALAGLAGTYAAATWAAARLHLTAGDLPAGAAMLCGAVALVAPFVAWLVPGRWPRRALTAVALAGLGAHAVPALWLPPVGERLRVAPWGTRRLVLTRWDCGAICRPWVVAEVQRPVAGPVWWVEQRRGWGNSADVMLRPAGPEALVVTTVPYAPPGGVVIDTLALGPVGR